MLAVVITFAAAAAAIEVNLVHRAAERVKRIATHLCAHSVKTVREPGPNLQFLRLNHGRSLVDLNGIAAAGMLIVPEDGNRAALADRGTTEVVICSI